MSKIENLVETYYNQYFLSLTKTPYYELDLNIQISLGRSAGFEYWFNKRNLDDFWKSYLGPNYQN